jgi:RHO1 GDP-GTP exchange protein 1/2
MAPLRDSAQSEAPVVKSDRLRGFMQEVFFNVDAIEAHHSQMLKSLFERQREQHPLIQSVVDIILDRTPYSISLRRALPTSFNLGCLLFRDDYEAYIKHYP